MLAERRPGSTLIAKLTDHSIELICFARITVIGHQLIGAHCWLETRNRDSPIRQIMRVDDLCHIVILTDVSSYGRRTSAAATRPAAFASESPTRGAEIGCGKDVCNGSVASLGLSANGVDWCGVELVETSVFTRQVTTLLSEEEHLDFSLSKSTTRRQAR